MPSFSFQRNILTTMGMCAGLRFHPVCTIPELTAFAELPSVGLVLSSRLADFYLENGSAAVI